MVPSVCSSATRARPITDSASRPGAARLSSALGYRFADETLLRTALTHRSQGSSHNERLEFLGDSLLNCAVALALYHRFPHLPEGDLSRLRAHLVRQDALHQLALELDLGTQLHLGEGELKSGGETRPSILADALEAVFGAIFLDGGFAAAQEVIARLYEKRYAALHADGQPLKDPKTRLQEWLQARRRPLPRYTLTETSGAAHAQRFSVLCEAGTIRMSGQGASRRLAEQAAAEAVLQALEA